MSELVTEITACRSCGSGSLEVVLDLGTHAVSDFYDTIPDDELRAPLCLAQCQKCALIQLTHSVSRDRLYEEYWYHSGLNSAMVDALKNVVDDAMWRVDLGKRTRVLDVGANDGTLLNLYPPVTSGYGFEPSNLYREAVDKGFCVFHAYYPDPKIIHPGHYKIISSIAMFYDVDDPHTFVKAIKEDLHADGIWVNQFMDLQGMLHANAFDNIAHEHTVYWSASNFDDLVSRHDLHIIDMSRNLVNGGSVRFITKHGEGRFLKERPLPVDAISSFRQRIYNQKMQCLNFLRGCKRNGKTILGLGASTKGATLLQYYGLDSDLLPAIGERNPDKVGKITAGSHIPIISEQEMRDRKPDYLLVFPWHFLDNLLEREKDLIAHGTRLVVPLPTFRVVE